MKQIFILLISTTLLGLQSCKDKFNSDASGTFESNEIIVSAEQSGKLLSFIVHEGDILTKGSIVGQIDVTNDQLRADQVKASIHALNLKTNNPQEQVSLVKKQLAVQTAQLAQLQKEKTRVTNLLSADAATQKQLDDINASIDQLNKQMDVTQQQLNLFVSNINTQNRSILSEQTPLEKSAEFIQHQISKGQIICPMNGTVLTQYAYEGEMTATGKALFKIANLDTLTLKAYITGTQLPQIKLGQSMKVLIDDGKGGFKSYEGKLTWISSKSEFTPKTIQTKDERANLVFAIKISVKNDGYLKIGMYGEVKFNESSN